MKKFIATMAAILFILCAVTACGNQNTDGNMEPNNSQSDNGQSDNGQSQRNRVPSDTSIFPGGDGNTPAQNGNQSRSQGSMMN